MINGIIQALFVAISVYADLITVIDFFVRVFEKADENTITSCEKIERPWSLFVI